MRQPDEAGTFAFCALAWQHAQKTPESPDASVHVRLGRMFQLGTRLRRISRSRLAWALRILAVAAAATLFTLHIINRQGGPAGIMYIAASLLVLQAAAAQLTMSLWESSRAKKIEELLGFEPTSVGQLPQNAHEVVEDEELGLMGHVGPTIVLGGHERPIIPVDHKAPKSVEPWVKLRLASRLRLMELARQKTPEYGLAIYEDGVMRVQWDNDLRSQLTGALQLLPTRVDAQNRSHDDATRCTSCRFAPTCQSALV